MTTSSTKDDELVYRVKTALLDAAAPLAVYDDLAHRDTAEILARAARQALSQSHGEVRGNAAFGLEERNKVIEECAAIAEMACLVPPDGGCPHPMEVQVADVAAERIRALLQSSKTGETA